MRLNNLTEGWSELPPINREKYQERDGLEGPIMTRSGKVVYYDPKAGSYYDPDTDMYISYDDWRMLDKENMHQIDLKSENSELRLPASTAGLRTGINFRSGAKASGPVSKATYDREMGAAARASTAVKPKAPTMIGGGRGIAEEDKTDTKYGIIRYPDTAISYIKNDGEGWEHIYDKSYGFSGPVDKADLKYAKKIDKDKIPSRMFEGRMSDQLIHDSETMSREEFAKKHGREVADEYFESEDKKSSNPAMDRALRRIEKTFSPERNEISDKVRILAQAVEMMSKPQWRDRALAHASQLGLNSVEEIKQELLMLLKNEQELDDEDIDTSSNVRSIERTLEKLDSLNESSQEMVSEAQFDEAAGEKDACYHKVKSRYKVWPSAYASGALVKCRKVGASNWGNSKK